MSIVLVGLLLVGPDKYGAKYANAGGCMHPHALAYFSPAVLSHLAQKSRGKYANACGCMQPRALAYVFPLTLLVYMAQTSMGDNYAIACGCMQPRALAYFCSPYFSGHMA